MANEVTLSIMDRLYSYWDRQPPVHELLAAFVGYKAPKEKPKTKQDAIAEFHGFIAELGGTYKGERAKIN